MSELKVNKVSPRSGTTVTIGDSGDTINIVGTLQNNGSSLTGDISSVVAGTGLSGGGTSGDVTLNIEAAQPTITSLGTITGFTSTGIDDNASTTSLTIASDGRTTLDATNEKALVVHHSDGSNVRIGMNNNTTNSNEIAYEGTDFVIKPGGTEEARLTATGLGIGTASPTSKLSLEANSPDIMFTDTSGGTDSKKWRVFGLDSDFRIGCRNDANSSGQTAYEIVRSGATIDNHRFSTGGSERMRITDAGRIGIGSSSPGTNDAVLIENGQSYLTIKDAQQMGIQLYGDDTNVIFSYDKTAGSLTGGITFAHNDGTMNFKTGGNNNRLLIDSSGNVGIGTTSPSQKLEVSGTALIGGSVIATGSTTTTASRRAIMTHDGSSMKLMASGDSVHRNMIFFRDGGDDEAMRITTSNTVGIGTSSPGAKLHIYKGSSGGSINSSTDDLVIESNTTCGINILTNAAAGGNAVIYFCDESLNNVGGFIYNNASNYLETRVNGSQKLKIDSSGHVLPGSNDAQDLGSTSLVWRNIYTGDLHLSNEAKSEGNAVDGTKGNWTIQEGAEDLYILNNKTGKKFKFKLEEIS